MSIKELAKILNLTPRALQKRCKKGDFIFKIIKNKLNRKTYEILISSLPLDIQEKIKNAKNTANNTSPAATTMSAQIINPLNPALIAPQASPVSSYSVKALQIQSSDEFSKNSRLIEVPQVQKELALAKFDVLTLWQDFRAQEEIKEKANSEFIKAFNKGLISKPLLDKTGEISRGTLYRWQKILKENNGNYTALINNYGYGKDFNLNTTLSDFEKQEFINIFFNDAKLDLASAYNLLKFKFNKMNMPIKSEAAFRRFVNFIKKNHNDFLVLSREGEKALKDTVVSYIRRDISDYAPGDILVADGNKLDFMVINPLNGRPCRAIWVAFFDWVSKDVVGSEIMLAENTQCISSALRNAIIRLGRFPKEVYLDNGRAFRGTYFTGSKNFNEANLQGVYKSLGINVNFAKPYNGRAKTVERFFGEFVKSCPPLVPSYIGNSIKNRPAHYKRNEKFHKELHKNDIIPTIEQAKMIIETWLEFYRTKPCSNVKGKTIKEAFEMGKGKGIDLDMLDELMMSNITRTVKRNTIKLFGHEYESTALYGKTGEYVVKYSLFDITKIKIYTLKGEYVGEAKAPIKVKGLAKTGSAVDFYTYKQELKKQNEQIKSTINKTRTLTGKYDPLSDIYALPVKQNGEEIEAPKDKYIIDCYTYAHKIRSLKSGTDL